MRNLVLLALALPLMAASPPRRLTLTMPEGLGNAPTELPRIASRYQPAPLPDQSMRGPVAATSSGPSLAPTLFTTREQFRGDGFTPQSTAQAEQERNLKPSVGFKLHLPITPQ